MNFMSVKKFRQAIVIALLAFTQSVNLFANPTGPVSKQPASAVLYWNEIAYQAFGGTTYQHSLMASRINVMVHLAIHDALNGIEEKYSRYAFTGTDRKADPLAATAAAAHMVLVHEIPAQKAFVDSVLRNVLKQLKNGDAKTKGIALGIAAAKAVLEKRANDGAGANPIAPVAPSIVPGIYQAVPPFDFVFAPHWKDMQPFALQTPDQFRSKPHPSIQSEAYGIAWKEVKETGKLNSSVRTPDQTAYAKFWYEFSEAGWNRVARVVAVSKDLNLLDAARLLALVDMAMADAYIAGWDSKFHYNFWRPYTAIRNADTDGNNTTTGDKTWEPSEPTPPVHDYPSTHSALGNAAATVLAMTLGDATPFTMGSPTALASNPTRSFTSFSQAADENADSRVMAGIHFRFSCEAGQDMGNKIGEWVVKNWLNPLK
jgi:hypothetical protein